MSWNYRIVKYADGSGFGLHEVQYDKNGNEVSMTADPCGLCGDTLEELRGQIMVARMDSIKRPVFEEPTDWSF